MASKYVPVFRHFILILLLLQSGECKRFSLTYGQDTRSSQNLLNTFSMAQPLFCAFACQSNAICGGFNFDINLGQCDLVDGTSCGGVDISIGSSFYVDLNFDACLSIACGVHGSCTDGDIGYTCTCDPGYFGSHCEFRQTQIWSCNSFPWSAPFDGCDWTGQGAGVEPSFSWGRENFGALANPDGGSGSALRVFYETGDCVCHADELLKGGCLFYAKPFSPQQEVHLEYEIMYSENFDFVRGGKAPGLYGGEGSCSGGVTNDCFSLRFMWRTDGDAELYAYFPHETGDWFCEDPNVHCNFQYGHSLGRGTFRFETNRWYRWATYLKLNDIGSANGEVRMYADGVETYRLTGLTIRNSTAITIDSLVFSTFFGGGDETWASTADVYTYYRRFKVWDGPNY